MKRSRPWALAMLLGISALAPMPQAVKAQSGIEGVDGWADAVAGWSTRKWGGQRVATPEASVRPSAVRVLDSSSQPLRVYGAEGVSSERLASVLRAAEATAALMSAAGLFELTPLELYVSRELVPGAHRDETEHVSALDTVRAFAVVDAALPASELAVCITEALLDAMLMQLDPAEAAPVRRGSAMYFAWLAHGSTCSAGTAWPVRRTLFEAPAFFDYLTALGAHLDQNRGAFVQMMWSFARQRTWEGAGLRGSPDLLEAIGKRFEQAHLKLEEVAGEIADQRGLLHLDQMARVRFGSLPVHRLPAVPPLSPLDSDYLLVDLETSRSGAPLTVWAEGEYGVRWVLSATALDADSKPLTSVHAPVHRVPNTELTIELSARARYVLISITNLSLGVPGPDVERASQTRSVRLIVDQR